MNDHKANNTGMIFFRGIIGMVIGGVMGVYGFFWIVKQGFYAMILPGVLAGFGCRLATPIRVLSLSIFCAVFSLGLGLYTEWMFAPFIKDKSLIYFITYIHDLRPISLIMIALGGVSAFWIADRR